MEQKPDNSKPGWRSANGLILPWFVSTKNFVTLWVLLALLLFFGIAMMFLRVPVYSAGVGVVADWQGKTDSTAYGPVIIAFFPTNVVSQLVPGRRLSFQLDTSLDYIERPIVEVKAKPFDRAAAAREFGFAADAKASLPEHAAVAIAELGTLPQGTPAAVQNGRIVHARYLLTTRRVGSFFPLIGNFFRD
jgi:hypothetical protein